MRALAQFDADATIESATETWTAVSADVQATALYTDTITVTSSTVTTQGEIEFEWKVEGTMVQFLNSPGGFIGVQKLKNSVSFKGDPNFIGEQILFEEDQEFDGTTFSGDQLDKQEPKKTASVKLRVIYAVGTPLNVTFTLHVQTEVSLSNIDAETLVLQSASSFENTAELIGVEVFDEMGGSVSSGVTIVSAMGTDYLNIPEPSALGLVAGLGGLCLRRERR